MKFFEKEKDILAEINLIDENDTTESAQNNSQEKILNTNTVSSSEVSTQAVEEQKLDETINLLLDGAQESVQKTNKKDKVQPKGKIKSGIIFTIKYLFTTTGIFIALMLAANYNAYFNIVYSYVFTEEMEAKQNQMLESLENSKIQKSASDIKKIQAEQNNETQVIEKIEYKKNIADIKPDNDNLTLDIHIAPYDNRLIIPKIGKNIPLLDVENDNVNDVTELHNTFMEDLKNGVVRYPGSAKPGQRGNSFIFGHSSNLPWIKGDYNEVFATLDNLIVGDEIISYYDQKKYTYKVTEKSVIRPGEVEALEAGNGNKRITLMTCWPVGTTQNRLIVIGEIVEEE